MLCRRILIVALFVFVVFICGLQRISTAAASNQSESGDLVTQKADNKKPEPGKEGGKKENGGKTKENKNAENKPDEYELQRILVDTIDQVERNYVKGISRRELIEAAIDGVLRKLDPYSTYISPKDIERFRSEVENEFCGIGIQIDVEAGRLMVISPLEGTPAYQAGILAGDRILKIDGESTEEITIDEAVRRLKGKEGSKVVLLVLHAGGSEPVEISVVRKRIQVKTVLGDSRDKNNAWDYMLDKKNRIGYIRITIFGRETAGELRSALETLEKQGMKGLILDMRFNPGGLLSSAIEVADMFVSKGLIVATSGRNIKERKWEARKNGTFEGFPMVVLVNRISASASEIVAACLQDHKRATVMGERTWGKGSVQNVISLEEGHSALKLTTASYRRPSGEKIHRFPGDDEDDQWGVTPNDGFVVDVTPEEMVALIHRRSQRDIVGSSVKPQNNKELPEKKKGHNEKNGSKKDAVSENADPLVKMALEFLEKKLQSKQ
ncbi:MAG: S41 family peptidase [Pirellulales bacterium]|nr:S41 family peptidase [Pirellulales bacterium]